MTAYLDSSVILRYILKGESAIKHALSFPRVVSSELTEVECRRTLHRLRMTNDLDDETVVKAAKRLDDVLDGIDLVVLSGRMKRRAMESFPVVVKTLDALHLATALAFHGTEGSEGVSVFSHDRSMNLCACALGLRAPLLEE
jgi:predicted nucleic acid-binding protein